jgi:hypothetical protein
MNLALFIKKASSIMKQIVMVLTFLLISINGYCDTLDYWHVYVNDSLIAEFNSTSKNLTININRAEIKNNDSITVRYGSDHPCFDCYYGLTVFAEIKQRLPETETKEHFGKLSISFKELLDIKKRYKIYKFPFNYYERAINEVDKNGRLLFILIIA